MALKSGMTLIPPLEILLVYICLEGENTVKESRGTLYSERQTKSVNSCNNLKYKPFG